MPIEMQFHTVKTTELELTFQVIVVGVGDVAGQTHMQRAAEALVV